MIHLPRTLRLDNQRVCLYALKTLDTTPGAPG
jgi:hypothetical protein